MYKYNFFIAVLLILTLGCAEWKATPNYETTGSISGVTQRKVFVERFKSEIVSPESDVNILGFTIDPQSFLAKDIGKYVSAAIENEAEKTGRYFPVSSSVNADLEISGEVKMFHYNMKVDEIPMKGEVYAYYYKANFNLQVNCVVKIKGGGIFEKDYTSTNDHATIYHTLANWEKPFTEDLNLVIYEIVEELFHDIEKTFIGGI